MIAAGARYDRAIAVAEQGLAKGDDAELEATLGRAYHLRGHIHQSLQEFEQARERFAQAEAIRERLAAADIASIPALRNVVETQNSLALVLRKLGDRQGAYAQFAAAIDNSRRCVELAPQSADDQIHVGGILCNVAELQRDDGLLEEAFAGYASAEQTLQTVLQAHPDHPLAKQFLRNVRWGRAEALDLCGRHLEAAAEWEGALGLDDGGKGEFFRLRQAESRARAGRQEAATDPNRDTIPATQLEP